LFGARVCRPGAEYLYPDGTILIWRPMTRPDEQVPAGSRLIIQREQNDRLEFTVREWAVEDGRTCLKAYSPILVPVEPSPGPARRGRPRASSRVGQPLVLGVVLASWRPEPAFIASP
jgi:hypothetical protein